MTTQLIQTPFGALVANWTPLGLFSTEFKSDKPTQRQNGFASRKSSKSAASSMEKLESSFERYFQCGHFEWELESLDWTGIAPFQKEVLEACFRIPSGATLSYGQLASQCGRSNAARAVGGAMARNRWPLLIPCHRVVGGSGKLTGYSGTGGLETKRKLLDLESVNALALT